MKMAERILIAVFSLTLGWLASDYLSPNQNPRKETQLFKDIKEDLQTLSKNKELPEGFEKTAFIIYNFAEAKLAKVFGPNPNLIETNATGSHYLEAQLFQKADEQNAVIVQFSIFDRKTSNKVGEISRSYTYIPPK